MAAGLGLRGEVSHRTPDLSCLPVSAELKREVRGNRDACDDVLSPYRDVCIHNIYREGFFLLVRVEV